MSAEDEWLGTLEDLHDVPTDAEPPNRLARGSRCES
jgi:hypothetical protein